MVPATYDLRGCGWTLSAEGVALTDLSLPVEPPAWPTLVVGVADPAARARLLLAGFADATGPDPELAELEARALRLAELIPRYRRHLPFELELDLVARDAYVGGRALCLHPREFGLLWRLMACPGEAIGKLQLLREVWRLRHVPETNSLAVHVCRLRAKLGAAGLADLILSDGDGYRLAEPTLSGPALPLNSGIDRADVLLRLTDDPPLYGTLPA
jgi:hypothetical protein